MSVKDNKGDYNKMRKRNHYERTGMFSRHYLTILLRRFRSGIETSLFELEPLLEEDCNTLFLCKAEVNRLSGERLR